MKTLLTALVAFLMTTFAWADMTNGSFYVDNNVECHLVAQNGATTTNQFLAGYTYTVNDQFMMEMEIATPTMLYFAGGPIVQAGSNSTLIINAFEYEVKNAHVSPRKANIGPFNLGLTFNRGEFVVVYPKSDPTSTFGVYTPFTGDPYTAGKYVFLVSEAETTVYVIDKENAFSGKNAPSSRRNPTKTNTKTITVTKTLGQDEIGKYGASIAAVEKKADTVVFIIVNGGVMGALK